MGARYYSSYWYGPYWCETGGLVGSCASGER